MSDGRRGLGLSIVRSVVTAHGGQVSIQSQEGKGTTVRFALPVYVDR
jgi:signal transduction histidine kinase